jgi:hypothetical protein
MTFAYSFLICCFFIFLQRLINNSYLLDLLMNNVGKKPNHCVYIMAEMGTLSYYRLFSCFEEYPTRIHEVLMWVRHDSLNDFCSSTVYILVHSYYERGYEEEMWLHGLMKQFRAMEVLFTIQGNDFFTYMKQNKWKVSGNLARLRLSHYKEKGKVDKLVDALDDNAQAVT